MRRRPATVLAIVAVVAGTVAVLDQFTKALVRTWLSPVGTSVPIVGHLLRFTHTSNEGAAFGMLPGNRYIFIGVSLLVLTGIVVYVLRWKPDRLTIAFALGFVAGGALGNLLDRTMRDGFVTDFIQVPLDFPVFNIADSAIFIGVALLVWWLLFGPTPERLEGREAASAREPAEQAIIQEIGDGPAERPPAQPPVQDPNGESPGRGPVREH